MNAIFLYVPTSRSGVARYACELAIALNQNGTRLTLIVPVDYEFMHNANSAEVITRHVCQIGGKTKVAVLFSMIRQMLQVSAILLGAGGLRTSISVHLVSSYRPLLQTIFHLLLRVCGVSIFFTVHDILPHDVLGGKRSKGWARLSQSLVYRSAQRLHVHTKIQLDQLVQDFGINPSRIVLIPHGVACVESFSSPLARDHRNLLVLGSLRANKQIVGVTRAVGCLSREGFGVHLSIRGAASRTETSYLITLREVVSQHSNCVSLIEGFVTESEFDTELRNSGAIVLAYRDFASQSGVLLRAAQNGCFPICSSAVAGDTPILDLLGIQISEPVEVEEISASLRQFLSLRQDQRAKRLSSLRNWIQSNCGWPKVARSFAAWYVAELA